MLRISSEYSESGTPAIQILKVQHDKEMKSGLAMAYKCSESTYWSRYRNVLTWKDESKKDIVSVFIFQNVDNSRSLMFTR